MFHRLREYIRITFCDIRRDSVLQQIVIVAGICLPILILLGLKNGQIKDMGDKIRQNPQACSVEIYPHPRLNYEQMMDLKNFVLSGEQTSHIQNVLPLSYPCDIAMRSVADPKKYIDCVTITPTCKDDPRAKSKKADVIESLKVDTTVKTISGFEKWFWNPISTIFGYAHYEQNNVSTADIQDDTDKTLLYFAVSKSVLKKLDVKLGDQATVIVSRENGTSQEFNVVLAAAYEAKDDRGKEVDEGLAALNLVIMMKTFIYGDEVNNEHFKWAGIKNPPVDTYNGVFLFTNKGNKDIDDDLELINVAHDHMYEIAPVTDSNALTLYGLLKPNSMKNLDLHYIRLPDPKNPITGANWFYKQPLTGTVRNDFDTDEMYHFDHMEYIPWNFPLEGTVNGKKVKVYGVTHSRGWFKDCYCNPDCSFNVNDIDDPEKYLFVNIGSKGKDIESITLNIEGIQIPLKVVNYIKPEIPEQSEDVTSQTSAVEHKDTLIKEKISEEEEVKEVPDSVVPAKTETVDSDSIAEEENKETTETTPVASPEESEILLVPPAKKKSETIDSTTTATKSDSNTDDANSDKLDKAVTKETVTEVTVEPKKDAPKETVTEVTVEPKKDAPKETVTEVAVEPKKDAPKETVTEETVEPKKDAPKETVTEVTVEPKKDAPKETVTETVTKETEPEKVAVVVKKSQEEILTDVLKEIDAIYIPGQLLAHIHAFKEKRALYSNITHLFYRSQEPQTFNSILLQVDDINNVPKIVSAMQNERGYSVLANTEQIDNMQEMDSFLTMLIVVITVCVLLFGVITIFSTISDSTERKRGTIGILRVMGVSKLGIFFYVLLRSFMIALFATVLMLLFGTVIGYICIFLGLIGWIPMSVLMIFTIKDILMVIAGIMSCCLIGSLIPAWKASRIDPIQAVQEGRFK